MDVTVYGREATAVTLVCGVAGAVNIGNGTVPYGLEVMVGTATWAAANVVVPIPAPVPNPVVGVVGKRGVAVLNELLGRPGVTEVEKEVVGRENDGVALAVVGNKLDPVAPVPKVPSGAGVRLNDGVVVGAADENEKDGAEAAVVAVVLKREAPVPNNEVPVVGAVAPIPNPVVGAAVLVCVPNEGETKEVEAGCEAVKEPKGEGAVPKVEVVAGAAPNGEFADGGAVAPNPNVVVVAGVVAAPKGVELKAAVVVVAGAPNVVGAVPNAGVVGVVPPKLNADVDPRADVV